MSTATRPARVAGAARPERLFFLRELTAAGYGHRDTLHKRIADGELPAVRVGNAWKVRESDLPLLAQPIGAAPTAPTDDSFAQREAARPAREQHH